MSIGQHLFTTSYEINIIVVLAVMTQIVQVGIH